MQTHFSSEANPASTATTNQVSSEQVDQTSATPWTYLKDKVDLLLRVEQLLIKTLLLPKDDPQVIESQNSTQADRAPSPTESQHESTISLSELASLLSDHLTTETPQAQCQEVGNLLAHLPFVSLIPGSSEPHVTLINPKSIAPSPSPEGAAQCFLVIAQSDTSVGLDMSDQKSSQAEPLTLQRILDFVSESKFASQVKLLSTVDPSDKENAAAGGNNSPKFGSIQGRKKLQARFFAQSHTYALAVQAMLASHETLCQLTSSFLEQAMSVQAPAFDPVKAKKTLEEKFRANPTMQQSFTSSGQMSDVDILRHNIAQMYQYYNQLIFRRGHSQQQSSFQQRPFQPQQPQHLRQPFHDPLAQRPLTQTSEQVHQRSSVSRDQSNSVSRSRSRSVAKTPAENLLVSLDEAVLPPQIVQKARSTDPFNLVGVNKQGRSPSQEPSLKSDATPGGADGMIRYSKRQILQIFKGMGRFQSPLDHHRLYEIDLEQVGVLLRDKLLKAKPDVVLEHLRSEKAQPLTSNARIHSKLFTSVTEQLQQVQHHHHHPAAESF